VFRSKSREITKLCPLWNSNPPIAITAAPAAQEASVQVRVYDKDHKDYHNWDDNENHFWGQYQTEHHIKSHEFSKANKKELSQYWNWRHEHPDGK
jgi:hypothetical protein